LNAEPAPALDLVPEPLAAAVWAETELEVEVEIEVEPESAAALPVEEGVGSNWPEAADIAVAEPADNSLAAPAVLVAAVVAVAAVEVFAVPNMLVVAAVLPLAVREDTNFGEAAGSESGALTDWASNRKGPAH